MIRFRDFVPNMLAKASLDGPARYEPFSQAVEMMNNWVSANDDRCCDGGDGRLAQHASSSGQWPRFGQFGLFSPVCHHLAPVLCASGIAGMNNVRPVTKGVADLPLLIVIPDHVPWAVAILCGMRLALAATAGPIFRYRPENGPAAGEDLIFLLGALKPTALSCTVSDTALAMTRVGLPSSANLWDAGC